MRLGIKFCPPADRVGGSQHTQAANLIRAIYSVHPDVLLFSSSRRFAEMEGLPVESIGTPLARPTLAGKAAAYLREQASFRWKLRAARCDVLLCPFNNEGLLWTGGVPQVLIVRDLIPLVFPEHFPVTSWLWRLVFSQAIRNAPAIITVSEHTRADLVRILHVPPGRVTVVPNSFHPVSGYRAAPPSGERRPYILYVSSSHYPHKNILRLLEAYARLRKGFPHRLVIVGHPSERFTPALHAAIERLDLSRWVSLRSNLPDEELAGLYQHADLFVYPTLYEGFGMPPLEAMSCGIPVVASNRTAIPEVCGHAAHYVDPYRVEEIHQGMADVLGDSGLRSRLGALGLERVAQFDWRKTAASIVQVCRRAAAETAQAGSPERTIAEGMGSQTPAECLRHPDHQVLSQPETWAAGPGCRVKGAGE